MPAAALLLSAPMLFLIVAYLLPVGQFLALAVFDPEPTLRHVNTIISQPAFRIVLWNTFRIAGEVTLACLVLGYPLALRIATLRPRPASALMLLVIASVWVSLLVRNYAWLVLLGREGLISTVLWQLGLTAARQSLAFNEGAVIVGMTHVMLPYMVLPIVAALRRFDPALIRAAEGLGSSPWFMFRRVVFPLSASGVAAGSMLVFLISLGFYVTPATLGGRGQIMVANLIERDVNELLAWGLAACLSVVLLGVTVGLFSLVRGRLDMAALAGRA